MDEPLLPFIREIPGDEEEGDVYQLDVTFDRDLNQFIDNAYNTALEHNADRTPLKKEDLMFETIIHNEYCFMKASHPIAQILLQHDCNPTTIASLPPKHEWDSTSDSLCLFHTDNVNSAVEHLIELMLQRHYQIDGWVLDNAE